MIYVADMVFYCLILIILTMTKYHENLLRDLSLLFIVNSLSFLETKMVLKIPNETFLRITRYLRRMSDEESGESKNERLEPNVAGVIGNDVRMRRFDKNLKRTAVHRWPKTAVGIRRPTLTLRTFIVPASIMA